MANKNKNLNDAARAKKDEFYTQLEDIERELHHEEYQEFFKGKTVLCNCDDPYESEFFKYFAMNFNALELKKLIVTCYAGSPVAQTELNFDTGGSTEHKHRNEYAYKVVINEFKDWNGDGREDLEDIKQYILSHRGSWERLQGNGDFRSAECIEILKEADVVVTNPPFSLFREYVAQLMQYDKKFVIVAPLNSVTYKEIFPLIQGNKIWLGYGFRGGDPTFKVPSYYEERETRFWIDEKGQKWRSFGNMTWYTNIPLKKYLEELLLVFSYYENPEKYPKYDNYDAIEVSKTAMIPYDYTNDRGGLWECQSPSSTSITQNNLKLSEQVKAKVKDSQMDCGLKKAELPNPSSTANANTNEFSSGGKCNGVMGVPITFLDKYNPNQFEILGCSDNGAVPDKYKLPHFKKHNEPFIDGKKTYKRLFIRRRA